VSKPAVLPKPLQQQPDRVALLLDVGGVLLLPDAAHLTEITARYGGADTPAKFLRAHYAAHNAAFPSRGPSQDYYLLLPRHAGVPEEHIAACAEEYRTASQLRNMWRAPSAESKATLAAIVAAGVPVAIVSQADGTIAQMLLDADMCHEGDGPAVRVDTIVDSTVVGFDKPDPRLFQCALDRLGVPGDRAVHVGDTVPADVRGAEAAGVTAVHFDPYEDCDDPSGHHHIRVLADVRQFLDSVRAATADH
jgi:putative hydrolase of the HAD superfamily